jgi:hypothetical protein
MNAMPFIPVDNVIEAELRMRLDGQRIENTLYFYKVTGWSAADVPVVFNALLVWWNTYYSVPVSSQLSLNEIKITDLSSETGFAFEIPTPTPKPTGDSADPSAPNNVALCVSFRTASRGRSARGRNYVPGIPKTAITANTVDTVTTTAIAAAYNQLLTVADTLGADWCVVSRRHNNDWRPAGVVSLINAATLVDSTVDSQRRRLPGRGL